MLPRSQGKINALDFVGQKEANCLKVLSPRIEHLGFKLIRKLFWGRYPMAEHPVGLHAAIQQDRKRFSTEPSEQRRAKSRKMFVPQNNRNTTFVEHFFRNFS